MVTVHIEDITPAKAAEYLASSEGNRKLMKNAVNSYANALKKGNWMLNGETIVFDTDGHLLNGHHRMQAIINSGVAMPAIIVIGITKEAYRTFDKGRHRTLAQDLEWKGSVNTTTISAGLSVYLKLRNCKKISDHNADKYEDQASVLSLGVYDEYHDELIKIASKAKTLVQRCRIIPDGLVTGTWLFLNKNKNHDMSKIEEFFNELISYDTSKYAAIDLLRKRLLTDKNSKINKLPINYKFNLLVRTWNYWLAGVKPTCLKWTEETEGQLNFE